MQQKLIPSTTVCMPASMIIESTSNEPAYLASFFFSKSLNYALSFFQNI